MSEPIPFHEFKRIFKRHGIDTVKTGGKHPWTLRGEVEGRVRLYSFPVHKNGVRYGYLRDAWREFRLPGKPGE